MSNQICRPRRARGLGWALAGFIVLLVWRGVAADEPRFAADRPLDMQHIRLDLAVDLPRKQVDAVATLRMTPLRPVTSVKLDAVGFDTRGVTLAVDSAAAVAARHADDGRSIEVFFGQTLHPGQQVTLHIDYALHEPRAGLFFFGPSADDPQAAYQLWSQGQATDNRHWIPCFDHPNERQTSELVVTVDSAYQVLSNGRRLSTQPGPVAGRTVHHWLQDKPHVAYLIMLVVGKFHVHEQSWRGVPVTYWVPASRRSDVEATFGDTLRMLDFFSETSGIPYPWDQYAQVCCSGGFSGGMENTSATTLGEDMLQAPPVPADGGVEPLIAHELAHQWWGDLVTCREWAHLWLNEGFASYFEALWQEHDQGPEEFAYNLHQKLQGAIEGGRERPIVDRYYQHPGQLFDARAYDKGAWVLHMLRCRLGDEAFWKVIRHYGAAHAYGLVETVDLRRAVEQVTDQSFERFFYDWTERPGHPVLEVNYTWDEASRAAEVRVRQTQGRPPNPQQGPPAEAFHFPLTLEFTIDGERAPVVVTRPVAEREVQIVVPLPRNPVMLRVDPGQTVLKEIRENKGRDLWLAQLTRDPDPVGRIRAARALLDLRSAPTPTLPAPIGQMETLLGTAGAVSDPVRSALAGALRTEPFWAVQCELARMLGELGGDMARDALIFGLGAAHPAARRVCVEALGGFSRDPAASAAVRRVALDGDASERVAAAAVATYARLGADDLVPVMRAVLQSDSPHEGIRTAALEALGERSTPDALDLLLEWTAPDRPAACRRTAVEAVGRMDAGAVLDEAAAGRAVAALAACLHGGRWELRAAAAKALGGLGQAAAGCVALLEDAAGHDAHEAVRQAAREALERIRTPEPAQPQLNELRNEVAALRDENRQLRQQLQAAEEKAPPATAPATRDPR